MTEKMFQQQLMVSCKGFSGFIKHLATLKLAEIEKQKKADEDDLIIIGHNLKLQSVQDERNAQYFTNLLSRRKQAIQEFTIVQKAMQRQKLKNSPHFKSLCNKELYDKFDSIPTPSIMDFDIIYETPHELHEQVRRIARKNNFNVHYIINKNPQGMCRSVKYTCLASPYFEG
jgi:hypothetical protein